MLIRSCYVMTFVNEHTMLQRKRNLIIAHRKYLIVENWNNTPMIYLDIGTLNVSSSVNDTNLGVNFN